MDELSEEEERRRAIEWMEQAEARLAKLGELSELDASEADLELPTWQPSRAQLSDEVPGLVDEESLAMHAARWDAIVHGDMEGLKSEGLVPEGVAPGEAVAPVDVANLDYFTQVWGAVESDAVAEQAAHNAAQPQPQPQPTPEVVPEVEPERQVEAELKPAPEPEVEAEPEPKAEPEPEPEPEVVQPSTQDEAPVPYYVLAVDPEHEVEPNVPTAIRPVRRPSWVAWVSAMAFLASIELAFGALLVALGSRPPSLFGPVKAVCNALVLGLGDPDRPASLLFGWVVGAVAWLAIALLLPVVVERRLRHTSVT